MPEISRFLGIVVAMYYRDHNPPHFHAWYGRQQATIAIEDGRILAGNLPPRVRGLLEEWRLMHLTELEEDWRLARDSAPLRPIAPLDWILACSILTMTTEVPVLVEARPIREYRVWLRFADGRTGEVDLAGELHGAVFEALRDPEAFRQLRADPDLGTLVWSNGADLAPEHLYQLLAGEPLRQGR